MVHGSQVYITLADFGYPRQRLLNYLAFKDVDFMLP